MRARASQLFSEGPTDSSACACDQSPFLGPSLRPFVALSATRIARHGCLPWMRRHQITMETGAEAGKLGTKTDSGSVGSLKQCTAEAHTLVFAPVEEPACPNKFRRENTQSEKDRNRPGTGRHDHRDTENEQAEA